MTRPGVACPAISVVIPTLGREVLARALDALAAGTSRPAEVIVVDQSASPAMEAMVRDAAARGLPSRWIPSATRGRAAGVNAGVSAATTRFVAVTDDDCLAHPDWLERLVGYLEEAPGIILTGRVEGENDMVTVTVTSTTPRMQRRRSLGFDSLSGGNMALARETWSRIGPLDEDPRVRTAEDHEYAYRALRAGVPIRYVPDAAVTHLGWRTDEGRWAQYASYARSHGAFYGKYLRRGDGFMALRAVIHLLRTSRRWLVAVVRGNRERAVMARAYLGGLPAGIRAGWRSPSNPS